jgi:protein FAM32A
MPSTDYKASSSGALKLKGSSVTKKPKKKKPKTPAAAEPSPSRELTTTAQPSSPKDLTPTISPEPKTFTSTATTSTTLPTEEAEEILRQEKERRPKTEAERRAEELRRKNLYERLKKEGVKTHKESVEEFNRGLSRLSEHHDMPRIGPG